MSVLGGMAAVSGAIWGYLLLGRGMFWLARERDDRREPAEPSEWPAVVAVTPARNEADVIARAIGSLLAQNYPGDFSVVLVDDQSSDDTAEMAGSVAAALHASDRLQIVPGEALPAGWVGKMWAVNQGVARAQVGSLQMGSPKYLLLTDADISHRPDNLRRLVARAEANDLVLTSLMAKLSCESFGERMLIPAFVFFFDMLFPFAWVNRPARRTAAAAGGCMLVRRSALETAGGVASIRGAMIDDCALATRLKAQGPIWLGLTLRAESLRPYGSIGEIGRMISRSAYAQLGYSPLLLAAALIGMTLTYLVPPMAVVFGAGGSRALGLLAWLAMAISFQPVLRLYRSSPLWGFALPLIGALYSLFTLQSAVQVWRGRGGMWKGRAQALAGVAR